MPLYLLFAHALVYLAPLRHLLGALRRLAG